MQPPTLLNAQLGWCYYSPVSRRTNYQFQEQRGSLRDYPIRAEQYQHQAVAPLCTNSESKPIVGDAKLLRLRVMLTWRCLLCVKIYIGYKLG